MLIITTFILGNSFTFENFLILNFIELAQQHPFYVRAQNTTKNYAISNINPACDLNPQKYL